MALVMKKEDFYQLLDEFLDQEKTNLKGQLSKMTRNIGGLNTKMLTELSRQLDYASSGIKWISIAYRGKGQIRAALGQDVIDIHGIFGKKIEEVDSHPSENTPWWKFWA